MEIFALFIGFVLFGASVAFISLPFRQKQRKDKDAFKAHKPAERREAVLVALRDLDFDFKTGKVSEEDYTPLRAQLMTEVAQYIEAEEKEAEQLEALIRDRRTVKQQTTRCQHCEAPIRAGQRFCSKCGSAVNDEECPSCGKNIQAGDLFCSSCGNKIQIHIEALTQS